VNALAGVSGAFAAEGDRWTFQGVLTFDDAIAVLRAADRLPLPASGTVDLRAMAHADSAALAVLLALRRRAKAEGRKLAFAGMPPMLDSLARLYGIDALIAPPGR